MKKRPDYRAFAKKHFKDHTKALPMVYGTGYNEPKYVVPVPVKPKKKTKMYRVEFICHCGHSDIYNGHLETIFKYLKQERIPSCVRCTNMMNLKGILENFFIVLYIKILCLFRKSKKS